MQPSVISKGNKYSKLFIWAAFILFVFVVIKCAWLCDDAYISFRTAKNIVNGNGAVWNVGERVQSYTNPLFLFVFTALYAVTGEAYFTAVYLSMLLSFAAAYTAFIRNNREKPNSGALCILLLACSKAFVDYSTSGLENCMSFLIISVFMAVYFDDSKNRHRFLYLCLVTSLMAINRIDAIVLFIPVLIYEFFRDFKAKKIFHAFLGFSPFIAWELFSLIYYGFPFPNTAYAKLNVMTPLADRILQGYYYIIATFEFGDYVTVAGIITGLVIGFAKRNLKAACVAAGILLYVLYIFYTGGDFMVGRFLTLPLFTSAILINRSAGEVRGRRALAIAVVLIVAASIPPQGTISSQLRYDKLYKDRRIDLINSDGVCDERAYYYYDTGYIKELGEYFKYPGHYESPIMLWGIEGSGLKPGQVSIKTSVGFYGYFAPCDAYIVDTYALTNPLLARLPATAGQRTGHNERWIPVGYIQSLQSGGNMIEDAALHEYYDSLKLVVSAPLFEKGRLRAILDMNLGRYDHLIDEYVSGLGGVPDIGFVQQSIRRAEAELAG